MSIYDDKVVAIDFLERLRAAGIEFAVVVPEIGTVPLTAQQAFLYLSEPDTVNQQVLARRG